MELIFYIYKLPGSISVNGLYIKVHKMCVSPYEPWQGAND